MYKKNRALLQDTVEQYCSTEMALHRQEPSIETYAELTSSGSIFYVLLHCDVHYVTMAGWLIPNSHPLQLQQEYETKDEK